MNKNSIKKIGVLAVTSFLTLCRLMVAKFQKKKPEVFAQVKMDQSSIEHLLAHS